MSLKENTRLVRQMYDELNAVKVDTVKIIAVINKYYDTTLVFHLTDGDLDFEQFKQFTIDFYQKIPDSEGIVKDTIAEGYEVAARITWRGTHTNEYLGIAPTGKKISMAAIIIFRIIKGKIVEVWPLYDTFNLLTQLGAAPAITPKT